MNDAPQTSREAAVRLILGEMVPLLDRFDAASKMMNEGHGLFEADMRGLGAFMGRVEAVLQEAAETAAELRQLYARSIAGPGPGMRSHRAPVTSVPLKYLIACTLASSALVLGGMVAFNKLTVEQAYIGRAITKALPYLDEETKQKLEIAIRKSTK